MAELIEHPMLTYPEPDGSRTAGHSGVDTSRERAVEEARTGKTLHVQSIVMAHVSRHGVDGMTVAELRRSLPQMHHGSISSALTNLHRAGMLVCLTDKRERCHVYVRPEFVNHRSFRPAVRVRPGKDKAGAQDQPTLPEPQTADLERRIEDTDTALAAMATEAYEQGYGLGRDMGWQKGYDEGVEAAQKRPGALLEAKHLGMDEGRRQQAARTMALISNMRAQMKGKGPVQNHGTMCWMLHPLCAIDSIAKAQVIR
jgi:hypothetical protein